MNGAGVLWAICFLVLISAAGIGDGTFEAKWGGLAVLLSALGVRCVDGYLNIIIFRYIAQNFPREEQAVTMFFGGVLLAFSFSGSLFVWLLVEMGVLAD